MQRRVHRNSLLYITPIALFGACSLLLLWAVIRQNLPSSTVSNWPWKIQLLDIDSATTAVTITGGLILARAQYASAARPMIGWSGNIVAASGYSDKLIWLVRVTNGCATPAYFRADGYRLYLKVQGGSGASIEEPHWVTRDEAIALLEAAGLQFKFDYDLNYFGPAFPLSLSSGDSTLALFTPKAMQTIDDLLIRVRARDLAGDTHERIIYCMRGAEREPAHPDHAA